MAILKSGKLSFDFRYTGFEYGWVQYQFYFLWRDEPIVRDEVLKRQSDYWNKRPQGAFLANDHESDGFLPFLKKVLDSNEADYWEPIEPDIVVALYPNDFSPFLKSHLPLVYESEESKQKREARIKSKGTERKRPDDLFTLIVFVDAYNFKDADGYYGQGLSMHMIVERQDVETFASELESEYAEFKRRFKVD